MAQRAVPTHPKIRLLQPRLVEHQGRLLIYLHDDLGITKQGALIPQPLAPLLALCDGTRDVGALRAGLLARTGAALPEHVISEIVAQLDDALLLENGAFRDAAARVMRKYRSAKHRRGVSRGGGVSGGRAAAERGDCGLLRAGACAEWRRCGGGGFADGDAVSAYRLRAGASDIRRTLAAR